MAWRPYENLIEGELDNTEPGRVTGWMRFVGMDGPVRLELLGDFHRDIRGAKVRLRNSHPRDRNLSGVQGETRPASYMKGFSPVQTGHAGDITAGLPPADYVSYPYVEWFGEENGRVVLELQPDQVEVIGEPIPWQGQQPVSRQEQTGHMARFLTGLCADLSEAGGRGKEHTG